MPSTLFDYKPTKYFQDQKPNTSSLPFTDSVFPPAASSLLGRRPDGTPYKSIDEIKDDKLSNFEKISWKRGPEMFGSALLFEDTISIRDIEQGGLGNCYFLAALASLATKPAMIYDLFITKTISSNGYYEIKMYIDGEWQIVVVDDFVPYIEEKDRPAFCYPQNSELWVVLLEKAWAKVNGGYYNIVAGQERQGFLALTGFPSKSIFLYSSNEDETFEELKTAFKKEKFCCAGTKQFDSIDGIIGGHAYSLLDAFEMTNKSGKTSRIVKIRNPHASNEWTGTWSKGSFIPDTDMDGETLRKRGLGIFYMPYNEFVKYYSSVTISEYEYDSNTICLSLPPDQANIGRVYNVRMVEKGKFTIYDAFSEKFFRRDKKTAADPVIAVAKYNKDGSTSNFAVKKYLSGRYLQVDLDEGYYVIWIYTPIYKKITGLNTRFFSKSSFTVKYMGTDYLMRTIKAMVLDHIKQSGKTKFTFLTVYSNYLEQSDLGYFYVKGREGEKYTFKCKQAVGFFPAPLEEAKEGKVEVYPEDEILYVAVMNTKREDRDSDIKCLEEVAKTTFKGEREPYVPVYSKLDAKLMSKSLPYPMFDEYEYITKDRESSAVNKKFDKFDGFNLFFKRFEEQHPVPARILGEMMELKNKNEFSFSTRKSGYSGQIDQYGSPEGIGVYIRYEGAFLAGQFKNGKLNGLGMDFFQNEMCYSGEFKDNQYNGKGKSFLSGRLYIEGTFINGKANGKGKYYFSHGDVWIGQFKDNRPTGDGLIINKDGTTRKYNMDN